MPLLVNKLIFGLVPERAPWIIRPLLRYVFSSITETLLAPRLKVHAKLVRQCCAPERIVPLTPGVLACLMQIEDHLAKGGEWFAGGQGPTFADYMMIFPLEAWEHSDPAALGPKTKEYVERIHRR